MITQKTCQKNAIQVQVVFSKHLETDDKNKPWKCKNKCCEHKFWKKKWYLDYECEKRCFLYQNWVFMMTSSNGNIFRVTGSLCGEFTGPGELPTQRPVTRSFDVFFDLRLNKPLSKQSWGWWFETLSRSLWRHRNGSNSTSYLVDTFNDKHPWLICLYVIGVYLSFFFSSHLTSQRTWYITLPQW